MTYSRALHIAFLSILAIIIAYFLSNQINNNAQEDTSSCITKFLLIRHGKTDWNTQQRIQGGLSDIPINQEGIRQAKCVAQLLLNNKRKIDAIYSSDLQRALATAHEISIAFEKPVIPDSNIREIYNGDAEGMLESEFNKRYASAYEQLLARYSDRWERWHHTPVPHAENKAQSFTRIETFLKNIANSQQGKTVAVVTHGGLIKLFITHLTERVEPIPNCSVVEIDYCNSTNTFSLVGIEKA